MSDQFNKREEFMLKSLKLTTALAAVVVATALPVAVQAQAAPKVAVDLTKLTSPFLTA